MRLRHDTYQSKVPNDIEQILTVIWIISVPIAVFHKPMPLQRISPRESLHHESIEYQAGTNATYCFWQALQANGLTSR